MEIAMPDKAYMPFVENCDYIKPLLEELQERSTYNEEIEKILKLYEPYQKAVKKITQEHFTQNNSKPELTERETQIAKLAADGFPNKEIGAKLFISQNTVKTQLKSIFEKIDINSRALLKQYFNKKN